ncbi:TlpA family protein disulfide reductase [Stutzerimonas nosocomialis]|uniref:TlpA disulfide reductase family protein n=1 Tax=Stutzerimonas nosocomialis TaxID=1056496 RepID=UPI00110861A7|nr:TlpA disulfide reductase family protein [Stutzerimonas nosocomialis]TLX55951.1 TlpA family protein disulfide reductase [Stutzerimonas nosocomialis]
MIHDPHRLFRPLLLCLLLGLAGCGEDWGVDQHGQTVSGDTLQGRWLVLNYWAEWCGPCRTEIPELNALSREASFEVLGVNFDGLQGDELAQASEAMGIGFRVLAQDPAERLQLPRSPVLPVTYLVDGEGKVRDQLVGEQTAEGIKARLARLQTQ